MAEKDKDVNVRVEELALSNMMTLNALVELLHEKYILNKDEVLRHVRRLIQVSESKPQ